jgi:hypothetical protein
MNVLIVSILAVIAIYPSFTVGKHSHNDIPGFSVSLIDSTPRVD